MTKPCSIRCWGVALLLVSAGSAIGQQQRPETLVPASFNQKQDSQGFTWDIYTNGCARRGTNYCFDNALMLQVNGSSFSSSSSQRKMTSDGSEYVLTYRMGNVEVTRRVKVDVANCTVRHVDVFQNTVSTPAALKVVLMTRFPNSVNSFITDRGGALGTSLARKESGLAALRIHPGHSAGADPFGGGQAPSALFYLGTDRSKAKPVITRQNSYLTITYSITVPPNKKVALLHGVAQRFTAVQPDAKAAAKLFEPFRSRKWTRDLPKDVQKSLLNARRTYFGEEVPQGPLLQSALQLMDDWGVDRGKVDMLVVDDQSEPLPGTAGGSDLTVQTRFGETTVSLGEVAVLVGGGAGGSMRTYLRNGEILIGPVRADGLRFVAESGLKIKLVPEQLYALVTHAAKADGVPPPKAVMLVETYDGDRLAVAGDPPVTLRAATAWGPIEVPSAQVRRLHPVRDPQPIHRLVTTDGSRMAVILKRDDLRLGTLRFGPLTISPGTIARLTGVGDDSRSPEEPEEPEESEEQPLAKVPHVQLVGDTVVVGSLDVEELPLVSVAGAMTFKKGNIHRMEREDNESFPFTVRTIDENEFEADLQLEVLPIRAFGRVWKVPTKHLLVLYQPKPPTADDKLREETAAAEKRQQQHRMFHRAIAALRADPNDAAAHLTLGRLYCFGRGNWKSGLPNLIKGSDKELAAVATLDLGCRGDPWQQVKIGDMWWTLADQRENDEQIALQLRAGFWYRKAKPRISGSTKVTVEKRLKKIDSLKPPPPIELPDEPAEEPAEPAEEPAPAAPAPGDDPFAAPGAAAPPGGDPFAVPGGAAPAPGGAAPRDDPFGP